MARRIDPRYFNNLIDANVLNRTNGPEDTVVDEILGLAEAGKITLLLPYSVKSEIEHPNTPADVKDRAAGLVFTEPVSLTSGEIEFHQKVRSILQGAAKPGKHDRDAFHVVESAKYGGYLITRDRRILNEASEITNILEVAIVTPADFVSLYRSFEKNGV